MKEFILPKSLVTAIVAAVRINKVTAISMDLQGMDSK
jgi:hypothetical protein